jgi:hypothetical protein
MRHPVPVGFNGRLKDPADDVAGDTATEARSREG